MHTALSSMMRLIEPLSVLLGWNPLSRHVLLQADARSAIDYAEWLGEVAIQLGLKILAAIAVLIVGNWIAKWLRSLTRKLMQKRDVDATVISFVSNLVYYAALIAVVIVALSQLGVETASFVAILGAAGLAIGLALQGSLSNFAAGILIILFRPFKAGDFIETAGATGTVEQVEIFTTTLKTPDNCKVIVPNSSVLSNNIKNYSGYPTRRVDMVFGISYSDDVDKARQIIWDVLNEDSRILADPEPTINLFQLADSSVNFAVRPWVNGADYWTVMCDTTETVKKRFDAAGISIPFPQRELHVYQK